MPFKPGQSGNPAGRKRKTDAEREVEQLARKHGPDAVRRLKHWMDSDNAKASVSAANALLDRGYGKPKQQIEAKVETRRMVARLPHKSESTEKWVEEVARVH